jgi:GNAT superfamily N-acetyltransferase
MSASRAGAAAPVATQSVSIRPAQPEDCEAMMLMIRALAEYQGVSDRVHTSAEALRRDGFGQHPIYASWEASTVLQITDLFVAEGARGTGVGFRLALEVARIAQQRGCAGLQLNMVHANPSRSSLDRIGFVHQDDLLHYRLDSTGLKKFLESDH